MMKIYWRIITFLFWRKMHS